MEFAPANEYDTVKLIDPSLLSRFTVGIDCMYIAVRKISFVVFWDPRPVTLARPFEVIQLIADLFSSVNEKNVNAA